MISPILYVWGDDELGAERLVRRFRSALEAESGGPLERWDVRPDQASAMSVAGQLVERLGTGALFGGGTLAVVADPGVLVRRNDLRDRIAEALASVASGNAVAFIEATRTGAKGPGSKRLAEAVTSAGGTVTSAMAPRPTALAPWIEREAIDRGLSLAPGAARELAERLGSRVTDGDVDRRSVTRIVVSELDKLALLRIDGAPVTTDDVRALVPEQVPSSVWALTDSVGERRVDAALAALDRLLDDTPEPVLVTVLHRRLVELLGLGDRLASGSALPLAARETGITNEFRARTLAAQARRWTTEELTEALAGLVELDAAGKGVPGYEADAAQRRLGFTLWVRDHVGRFGRGDDGATIRPR